MRSAGVKSKAPRRTGRSKMPGSALDARELVGLAQDARAALEGHVVLADQLHGAVVAVAVEGHVAVPFAAAGRFGAADDVFVEQRQVVGGAGVRAQPDQLG